MYGGSIENFFVHRNIFVALHHKIFPDGNRNVNRWAVNQEPRDFDLCKPRLVDLRTAGFY
jgi:hypothetical protein